MLLLVNLFVYFILDQSLHDSPEFSKLVAIGLLRLLQSLALPLFARFSQNIENLLTLKLFRVLLADLLKLLSGLVELLDQLLFYFF